MEQQIKTLFAAFTGARSASMKQRSLCDEMTNWVIWGMRACVKKTLRTRKSQLNVIIWATGHLLFLPLGLFLEGWSMQRCPICHVAHRDYEGTKRKWTNSKFSEHWGSSDMNILGLCSKHSKLYLHIVRPIPLLCLKHSIIQDAFNCFFSFSLSHQSCPRPSVKEGGILQSSV